MAKTVLDRLQAAFHVSPLPHRWGLDKDVAAFYGSPCPPHHNLVVTYVRHHYTNYEQALGRIRHNQVEYFEFKNWVREQIEQALKERKE